MESTLLPDVRTCGDMPLKGTEIDEESGKENKAVLENGHKRVLELTGEGSTKRQIREDEKEGVGCRHDAYRSEWQVGG